MILTEFCGLVRSQTKEECEHLISLAKPCLKKSRVVDEETGGTKEFKLLTWTLLKQRRFFFPSKFRDMMMFYITCDPCWLRAAAGQVQGCSWKEGRPGCLSDREKDCRSHLHTLRYVTQSLKSTSRTWRSVLNKRAIVVNTTCKAVNNHQQVQLVFLRPLVPFTSNAADLVFIV